jgi:quercetin dioxygenase-like cupin family protein
MFHAQKADAIELAGPAPAIADHVKGLRRATLVGADVGAVHTGFALVALEPGGHVGMHLHSTEQSFYILRGHPEVTLEGRTYRLGPNDCGFIPVGAPHAWRAPEGEEEPLFLEVNAPAPRTPGVGQPDTFWTGEPAPSGAAETPDMRDARTRSFYHLDLEQMKFDNLKVGASLSDPTVAAGMDSALLAYSGIGVKMLIDQRMDAALHTMFMVEYEPGGAAIPHDHPLEETYYFLEGEVEATADGEHFVFGPGDVFWTGVGCVHSFSNTSGARVRWLETQSPQPPRKHSYRFNRDWDYLADRLK